MATEDTVKKKKKKKAKESFEYHTMSFAQRPGKAPKLVFLHAPVKEVLQWATVEKLGPKSSGPQRDRREAKVTAIAKFLDIDSRNIIPTAVVLAFREGTAKFVRDKNDHDAGELTIKNDGEAAATIIAHESEWAAIVSMAEKMGCSAEALRKWVRQSERDAGHRPGLTTSERERMKDLEREVRELKRANEILRKASAYFAQAELDRPPK